MDTKITITKETGEVVTGDIIAAYKSTKSNKTFYFFTFHEKDGNGNENVHVSECVDAKLNKVSSDQDWNEVKEVMKCIVKVSKGEAKDNQDPSYNFVIFQNSVSASVDFSKDIYVPKDAILGMNTIYLDGITPKEEAKVDTGAENLASEVNIFDKSTLIDTTTNELKEADSSSNNNILADVNPIEPINNIEPVEIQESVAPENELSESTSIEPIISANATDLLNRLATIDSKQNELNATQTRIYKEQSELNNELISILKDFCNYIKKNEERIKDVNDKCDLNLKGIANVIQFQKQGGDNNQIAQGTGEVGNAMETGKAKVLTLSNGINSTSLQDSNSNSILNQSSVFDNAA